MTTTQDELEEQIKLQENLGITEAPPTELPPPEPEDDFDYAGMSQWLLDMYNQQQIPYTPTLTQQQAAEQQPRYDELGGLEKSILGALPAVKKSQETMDEYGLGIGARKDFNIVQRFGRWVGDLFIPDEVQELRYGTTKAKEAVKKTVGEAAMTILDPLSTGVERTLGLGLQFQMALDQTNDYTMEEFMSNLSDAWFAGSLYYDADALPKLSADKEGNWQYMLMAKEDPNSEKATALLQGQRRISELVAEGYERKEALDIARSELYDDLGALKFRAQWKDLMGHVVLDPLEVIMPILKPVERMHAWRQFKLDKPIKAIEEYSAWDQLFLRGTGGIPTEVPGKFASKVPWALTPESRAIELTAGVKDRIGTALSSNADSIHDLHNLAGKAVQQLDDPRLGNLFLSLEGRFTRSSLEAGLQQAGKVVGDFDFLTEAGHISFLEEAAQLTGKQPWEIVGKFYDDVTRKALLDDLVTKGMDVNKYTKKTPKIFDDITGFKNKQIPFTDDLARHYYIQKIGDAAEQLAAVKFGVKEHGLLRKASAALKSGETLAFLRTNWGFAVKNFFNNEMTLVRDGMIGHVSLNDLDNLISDVIGFEPEHFSSAFRHKESMMEGIKVGKELIGGAVPGKTGAIAKATMGGVDAPGKVLDKISNYINKIEFPGPTVKVGKDQVKLLDMGSWAGKAEASASRRAFYHGYTKYWKETWVPSKGFTNAYDALRGYFPDNVIDDLNTKITSSSRASDLDNIAQSKIHSQPIIDAMESQYGIKFNDLGIDTLKLQTDLDKAAAKGGNALRTEFKNIHQKLQDHIENLHTLNKGYHTELAKVTTQFSDGRGLGIVVGDSFDDFLHTRVSNNLKHSQIIPPSREFADVFWDKIFKDDMDFYAKMWERVDESIAGAKQGCGKWFPSQIEKNFKEVKNAHRDFFKTKRKKYKDYFKLPDTQQTPEAWKALRLSVDDDYGKMAIKEAGWMEEIDNAVVASTRSVDEELARKMDAFFTERRALWQADQADVSDFMRKIDDYTAEQKAALYEKFHKDRHEALIEMWKNERKSLANMSGLEAIDPKEFPHYDWGKQLPSVGGEEGWNALSDAERMAEAQKLVPPPSAVTGQVGTVTDDIMKQAEANWIKENPPAKGIPEDRVRSANPQPRSATESFDKFTQPYQASAHVYQRHTSMMLDDLEMSMKGAVPTPALDIEKLTPEQIRMYKEYVDKVKGELSDAKFGAIRYGDFKRDAALLNYNRRKNYNTWLGAIAPYEFWTTQSMQKWAIHSIDRPAMLATYLRFKDFINKAGAENEGFPTRLKGHLRVKVPFTADFMGNDGVYIDPLQLLLPFDNWAYGAEKYFGNQRSAEQRAARAIQRQIQDEVITSREGLNAIETMSGEIWEQAMATALKDDDTSPWDVIDTLVSPHPFAQWAWYFMNDEKDKIGNIPLRQDMKQLAGAFGVDPGREEWGVIGNIRRSLGLHAFDKFDDYRVERMLSNMAVGDDYTLAEIKQAMVTQEGEVWDEAVRRAAIEYSGGGPVGTALKLLGIPAQTFPYEEQVQRQLKDDYSNAWDAYNGGDATALRRFYDENPEYKARQALFKDVDGRIRQFVGDELWTRWFDMPKVHQDQVKEALGKDFSYYFLEKETRNIDNIPIETLQMWVKMMGGDPPGSMNYEPVPIDFAPPEIAWRAQNFSDLRNQMFPNWNDLQNTYYGMDESLRKAFRLENPELTQYWDWRREFLHRNPSIVPYVSDNFEFKYSSPQAQQQAMVGEAVAPQYTKQEWGVVLGSPGMVRIIDSGNIPTEVMDFLMDYAQKLGMTWEELEIAILNSQ